MFDRDSRFTRHFRQLSAITALTLRRNLHDLRFSVSVVLLLAISMVSSFLSNAHQAQRDSDYQRLRDIFTEDASLEAVKLARPPSDLLFLSSGGEDRLPAYLVVTPNLVDYPIEELSTERVALPFERLDWVFVVIYLFAFLALLLTYDLVSGQRESGTLSLLLANSVARPVVILGGLAGTLLTLAPCLVASLILFLLPPALEGKLSLSADEWLRILLLLGLAMVFLSVWALIGLLSSSWFQRPVASLSAAFVLWTVLTVVVPSLAILAGQYAQPVDSAQDFEDALGTARLQFSSRAAKLSSMDILERVNRPGLTAAEKSRAVKEFEAEIEETDRLARVWYRDAIRNLRLRLLNQRAARRRQIRRFAAVSPSELFRFASESLCLTGTASLRDFERAADDYMRDYTTFAERQRGRLREEAKEYGGWIEESGYVVNVTVWVDYGEVPFDRRSLPRFQLPRRSPLEDLDSALGDVGALTLMAVFAFCLCWGAISRTGVF